MNDEKTMKGVTTPTETTIKGVTTGDQRRVIKTGNNPIAPKAKPPVGKK